MRPPNSAPPQSKVAVCDGLDCRERPAYRVRLAKSGAKVLLCDLHMTRFAMRGLIAHNAKGELDLEDLPE